MTFQIAMVGCDGLVIGSDRLGRYAQTAGGWSKLPQMVSQQKFFVSDGQSIVCFAAGGPTAMNLARQISLNCDAQKLKFTRESEWQDAIYQIAAKPPSLPPNSLLSQIDDEVLVARSDVPDAFWFVLRRPNILPIPTVLKMQGCLCTGVKTSAQFIPGHLWTPKRSTADLKKLALITLSYAAQEEPSSVGYPFDIMILDKTGCLGWSVHNRPDMSFQNSLERAFDEYAF